MTFIAGMHILFRVLTVQSSCSLSNLLYCSQHSCEVVKLLLSHRANTRVLCNGHSPLSLAITSGNDMVRVSRIVHLLLLLLVPFCLTKRVDA